MTTQIRIEGCGKLGEAVRTCLSPYQYKYKNITSHYGPTSTGHCERGNCECYCVESQVPKELITKLEGLAYDDPTIVDWFDVGDLIEEANTPT